MSKATSRPKWASNPPPKQPAGKGETRIRPSPGSSSSVALRRQERAAQARARQHKRNLVRTGLVVIAVGVVAVLFIVASSSGGPSISAGSPSPNGAFTIEAGPLQQATSVASLRGRPFLLWLVTTWCSSCQAGTQAVAQNIHALASDGVRVVELEVANNFGQIGPDILSFGHQFADGSFTDPDWSWGTASAELTATYDPHGDLDLYYLVNSSGHIVYANSFPASTMAQLLHEASTM